MTAAQSSEGAGTMPDAGHEAPSGTAAISHEQRRYIDQTLAAVERFDDAFAEGKTDGPMPVSLREAIQRSRYYTADPMVGVLLDAMPHTLVYNDVPGCWCGETHDESTAGSSPPEGHAYASE